MAGPGEASEEAFGLNWSHPLFDYQRQGIERLLSSRSVLLADEMGLGKTIQAIAALRILAARREIKRALIVCPVGLIAQWRRQIRIWAPDLPVSTAVGDRDQRRAAWRANATLTLSNFESVRADLWAQSEAARSSWDVVVVDEAQRIKNAKSGVAAVVKSLERSRSWALTGTPLENRLDDLISVLDFAAPGEFDPGAMGVGLRGLMSRVQLRRRRAEVLDDLPPKFASVIGLDLTATQRAAYRKAEEKGIVWLRSLGRELRISHVLELILRLKQICNFCPETGNSAKLHDLRRRLEEFSASHAKALIFSQFVAEPFGVKRLARELREFRPLAITGGMDQAARSAAFDSLERDQITPRDDSLAPRGRNGTEPDCGLACHPFRSMVEPRGRDPSRGSSSSNWPDAAGPGLRLFVRRYRRRTHRHDSRGKKGAVFRSDRRGSRMRAGRLDLDTLLRAAAPAY